MSTSAKVHSIDALVEFRTALAGFGEQASAAIVMVEMEVRRMLQWIQNDRILFWQSRIRQLRIEMAESRAQLHRKRISTPDPARRKDTEEREDARVALRKLRHAEEQLQRVKAWQRKLQQAVEVYRGSARGLSDLVEADLSTSLGRIDAMIDALRAYQETSAPEVARSMNGLAKAHQSAQISSATQPSGTGANQ